MPIYPLEQFEADVAEDRRERRRAQLKDAGVPDREIPGLLDLPDDDRRVYERLSVPKTLVVRFGATMMVGEFPYRGDAKPGCGSKIVVRTHRGTEIGEMLTSTCPNSGCSKSVSRKEMLEYIDNSGGRQYPFFKDGKALRVATAEDLDAQARLEQQKHAMKTEARSTVARLALPMKVVDVEPILGGERVTVYFASEDRVDFRDLARELGTAYGTRVDLRQVGARDEARITADYEKCGQYCCCKNFLKVLKPISMRSAKVQKATLDPMKISGRCGRLMCCLRYEDETYSELRKRLPHRKTRVGTPDGDGIVIDSQILTQLVLVLLDDGERVAIPVEELGEPGKVEPRAKPTPEPVEAASGPRDGDPERGRGRKRRRRSPEESGRSGGDAPSTDTTEQTGEPGPTKRKRRRRRRKRSTGEGESATDATGSPPASDRPSRDPGTTPDTTPGTADGSGDRSGGEGPSTPRKKRRRRRRRRGGGDAGGDSGGGSGDGPGGGPSPA